MVFVFYISFFSLQLSSANFGVLKEPRGILKPIQWVSELLRKIASGLSDKVHIKGPTSARLGADFEVSR